MNSTVRDIDHQSAAPDPLVVFRCRAEARADLVAAGLYELQEAVDGLQADAEAQGLAGRCCFIRPKSGRKNYIAASS